MVGCRLLQGCLANEKTTPPRTLDYDYAWENMVVLGGWAFSYGRGTPVHVQLACIMVGCRLSTKLHLYHDPFLNLYQKVLLQGYLAHKKHPPP